MTTPRSIYPTIHADIRGREGKRVANYYGAGGPAIPGYTFKGGGVSFSSIRGFTSTGLSAARATLDKSTSEDVVRRIAAAITLGLIYLADGVTFGDFVKQYEAGNDPVKWIKETISQQLA